MELKPNLIVADTIPAARRTVGVEGILAVDGTPADLRDCRNLLAVLSVGAIGTGATLTGVKLQESDQVDGVYADVPGGAFADPAGAGMASLEVTKFKRFVKAVATVGDAQGEYVDFGVVLVGGNAETLPVA